MRKLLIIITSILITGMAMAQDPGMPDSVAFGNPDGSPIFVDLGEDVHVGYWIKCDENIAFMNFCMATENEYVPFRFYAYAMDVFLGWDIIGTLPVDGMPSEGLTSQAIAGTADFEATPPNFVNTEGEWVKMGSFVIRTSDNPQYPGSTSSLFLGEDPLQGETVIFNQFWTPINPVVVTSDLIFQPSFAPEIIFPEDDMTVVIGDHYPYSFPIEIIDNDDDDITMEVVFDYDSFELEEVSNEPGSASYLFTWTPEINEAITAEALFIASDTSLQSDTLTLTFDVRPVTISVSIDSILPGYDAEFDMEIEIEAPNVNVGGFNLFLTWDHNIMTFSSINFGDVFNDWDYAEATPDAYGPGTMVLLGVANVNQQNNPPLSAGTYPLASIVFETPLNVDLEGIFLPLEMPTENQAFNVLSDSVGYISYQPTINEGGVNFLSYGEILIGDVNLNLVAYEIGDAVVFIDHLSDPIANPFNNTQSMSSDCNEDRIPETIADLIFMLNVINEDEGGGAAYENIPILPASLELAVGSFSGLVSLDSNQAAGGVLVVINHQDAELHSLSFRDGLRFEYSDINGVLTAVVYSDNSDSVLKDDIMFFDISGSNDNIEIERYEISDPYGRLIK